MEKKYVVGIDFGTTGSKTLIVDLEGNEVGVGSGSSSLLLQAGSTASESMATNDAASVKNLKCRFIILIV